MAWADEIWLVVGVLVVAVIVAVVVVVMLANWLASCVMVCCVGALWVVADCTVATFCGGAHQKNVICLRVS